jgi:hypothetical protein
MEIKPIEIRLLSDEQLEEIRLEVIKITEEAMDSARRTAIQEVIKGKDGSIYFRYLDRVEYIGR